MPVLIHSRACILPNEVKEGAIYIYEFIKHGSLVRNKSEEYTFVEKIKKNVLNKHYKCSTVFRNKSCGDTILRFMREWRKGIKFMT